MNEFILLVKLFPISKRDGNVPIIALLAVTDWLILCGTLVNCLHYRCNSEIAVVVEIAAREIKENLIILWKINVCWKVSSYYDAQTANER